jgi:sialidase-1
LVVPCDCGDSAGWSDWDRKGRSLIISSDDHGESWRRGGVTEKGMNECEVVELADGSLLLSTRKDLARTPTCPSCQAASQKVRTGVSAPFFSAET